MIYQSFRRAANVIVAGTCILVASAAPAAEVAVGKPIFTESDIKVILSHGPWPAAAADDASNRVSGKPDAIEFGTRSSSISAFQAAAR
jgi:hypothetical protein